MLADFHVHTEFSDDSVYPMEQVAEDAFRLNLDALCFCDHVDYGVKPDAGEPCDRFDPDNGKPVTNVDYACYFPEVERVRALFDGRLTIRAGLELGVQRHTVARYEAVLDHWGDRLDFCLLSIHQVEDREFWNGDYQKGRDQDAVHRDYYNEMLAVMDAFDGYDSVAHLDLMRRYDPFGPVPFERVRDQMAAALEHVIAHGKAIELNTSSWRYGLDDTMPSSDVFRLYRDLGGTLLTLGSDSHRPSHLGSYLRVGQRMLRDLGFTEFVTYERRVPTAHPLAF